MKEYNKLVRDKIPEIIEKSGAKAITRTLTDEEYKVFLEKKLDEEVAEFHESKSAEEIADIIEVLYAICAAKGYSVGRVNTELALKRVERGSFTQKILLIGVEEAGGGNGLD
jgi:predicted house-cleaning noncanonical NTP pyrophosphatase (MazG superfamily)